MAGETRIAAGVYPITVRKVGGFNRRYHKRFPDFHQGMLWIRDVPHFEYILIHIGNTDADTAGCLIVGTGASAAIDFSLSQSTLAYKKLYKHVIDAALAGTLSIEYIDRDRAKEAA